MQILLVRHGESESNVDRRVQIERPDHDIELSALGREQAKACGEFLESNVDPGGSRIRPNYKKWRIWQSPYKRAQQTAGIIHEAMGEHLILDRREHIFLGEQQFGLFDGLPDEDLARLYPDEYAHYAKHEKYAGRFWARMPCGESRFDVASRVHQAFGTFHRDAERHGVENLIVVCHGVTIRAFVMMWLHKTVEWFENEPNPTNCSIRWLQDDTDRGYIKYWKDL